MKREKRARTEGGKVFWTDAEKVQVIAAAVATQAEHPDLAGLPLLRAAMSVLPVSRRRKLIALSQADWFEPGLALAYKLRDVERSLDAQGRTMTVRQADVVKTIQVAHEDDPYIPVLKEIAEATRTVRMAQEKLKDDIIDTQVAILREIRDEIKAQTSLLAQFVGSGPPPEMGDRSKGEPPQSYDAPPETKVRGYAGRRMIALKALAKRHGYDFDS